MKKLCCILCLAASGSVADLDCLTGEPYQPTKVQLLETKVNLLQKQQAQMQHEISGLVYKIGVLEQQIHTNAYPTTNAQ